MTLNFVCAKMFRDCDWLSYCHTVITDKVAPVRITGHLIQSAGLGIVCWVLAMFYLWYVVWIRVLKSMSASLGSFVESAYGDYQRGNWGDLTKELWSDGLVLVKMPKMILNLHCLPFFQGETTVTSKLWALIGVCNGLWQVLFFPRWTAECSCLLYGRRQLATRLVWPCLSWDFYLLPHHKAGCIVLCDTMPRIIVKKSKKNAFVTDGSL